MSKERTYKWDVAVPFVAMIILLINGIARKNWITELKEFKILPWIVVIALILSGGRLLYTLSQKRK